MIALLAFGSALSQTTDLARVEYLYLPFGGKSENTLSRYRALIQAPIPINKEKKNYLVIGLEYRYVDINIVDIEDTNALFGRTALDSTFVDNNPSSVEQMDIYAGYTWSGKNDWRFGVKGGVKIQSDFESGTQSDDFLFDGAIYAIKDKKNDTLNGAKPYRLVLGLSYSTTPGRNFPLPIVNYYREFQPNWTYTLGVPKTNIRHYLNDSHKDAIQAFLTIDNVYANIQTNFVPKSPDQNPDNKVAESIQETIGIGGLGYEHFFTEHLLLYVYAAHSFYNDFRFEAGDGEKIYIINDENGAYLRTGLKFKF